MTPPHRFRKSPEPRARRRLQKRQAQKAGRRAEFWALWMLRAKAYHLVARNYQPPYAGYGEIDLIMRRGRLLIFVEVKYRPDRHRAKAAISTAQWRRIGCSAAHFVAAHKGFQNHLWRFDLVACAPAIMPRHIADCWRMR